MLQSMGLQRVGHDWVTEQQQHQHLQSQTMRKQAVFHGMGGPHLTVESRKSNTVFSQIRRNSSSAFGPETVHPLLQKLLAASLPCRVQAWQFLQLCELIL